MENLLRKRQKTIKHSLTKPTKPSLNTVEPIKHSLTKPTKPSLNTVEPIKHSLTKPTKPKRVIDKWEHLKGLRVLSEDKAFLLGFSAGAGLDDEKECDLVKKYAELWRNLMTNRVASDGGKEHDYMGLGRWKANDWLSSGKARNWLKK